MSEKQLQIKIIKYLKFKGAYVIKTRPGAGTPRACPDILALYKHKHAEIEVKRSADADFQPGQEVTLAYLAAENDYVYVAYPENWPIIELDLDKNFFD